jgi:hypothetical protein
MFILKGLAGMEWMSPMIGLLQRAAGEVTFVIDRNGPGSRKMVERELARYGIPVRFESKVTMSRNLVFNVRRQHAEHAQKVLERRGWL